MGENSNSDLDLVHQNNRNKKRTDINYRQSKIPLTGDKASQSLTGHITYKVWK